MKKRTKAVTDHEIINAMRTCLEVADSAVLATGDHNLGHVERDRVRAMLIELEGVGREAREKVVSGYITSFIAYANALLPGHALMAAEELRIAAKDIANEPDSLREQAFVSLAADYLTYLAHRRRP